LQLWAFFAFRFCVLSPSYSYCQRAVPDFLPIVFQDVAEAFKIALARVNVAVRSDAHVDVCGCARFDA
jgi:hypothetical protein